MPEDLWRASVDLAREHGVWCVSRALRVRYDTLRRRLEESSVEPERTVHGFVELRSAGPIAAPEQASTIELSRADGTRLTIRLAGNEIDPRSLIDHFCHSR